MSASRSRLMPVSGKNRSRPQEVSDPLIYRRFENGSIPEESDANTHSPLGFGRSLPVKLISSSPPIPIPRVSLGVSLFGRAISRLRDQSDCEDDPKRQLWDDSQPDLDIGSFQSAQSFLELGNSETSNSPRGDSPGPESGLEKPLGCEDPDETPVVRADPANAPTDLWWPKSMSRGRGSSQRLELGHVEEGEGGASEVGGELSNAVPGCSRQSLDGVGQHFEVTRSYMNSLSSNETPSHTPTPTSAAAIAAALHGKGPLSRVSSVDLDCKNGEKNAENVKDSSMDRDGDGAFRMPGPGSFSRTGSSWTRKFSPSRLLSYISNLPLSIRGRAEAWETSRAEIQIFEQVGKGQTGVVHRCCWRRLECAAKILTTQGNHTIEYKDMVNEISTVSHLRHPNLVLFLGACTQNDGPLLLLNEFMAGGSLEQRFSKKRAELCHPWRPPRATTTRWIRDLTRAVHFLHKCCPPIIHRDLKPANILLSEEDVLKIADFGLSKVMKKSGDRDANFIMTGEAGTKRYMAPEVVRSEPYYDEKVDIYSMGMIFWYIVTGERPFEGVHPEQIARIASMRNVRPPLDTVRWPELEGLVKLMWADCPDTRPSAGEILCVIEETLMVVTKASSCCLGWGR